MSQYRELIKLLEQVKTDDDISEEVTDELVQTAVSSLMLFLDRSIKKQTNQNTPMYDLVIMSRGAILEHFDNIIRGFAHRDN